jgi:hypothetical protein
VAWQLLPLRIHNDVGHVSEYHVLHHNLLPPRYFMVACAQA